MKIGPASFIEGLVGTIFNDVLDIELGLENPQLERIIGIS